MLFRRAVATVELLVTLTLTLCYPVPLSRSRALSKLTILAIFLPPTVILAQTATPPPPQLSPKAAYESAMRPLELTRQSISNWSDTEVGALTVAMVTATKECATRDPKAFTGADLIDLAKLCSLGQNQPAVVEAATRYIAADGPKPQLTSAYADLIDAQLHLKDEPAALASAQAMLAAVPYDALTAETINEAIHLLQFVYTSDALALSLARQPHLLALLAEAAVAALPTPPYPNAEHPQSLHELYADGIELAALQQLAKAPPVVVATTLAALDAALPSILAADEAIPIALARRRYALLGQPLPDLARPSHPADPHKPVTLTSLDIAPILPKLPATHAITALLLFPDWCAQCLRTATKLPDTVFTVAGHEAYLYGLLAQTFPPNPPQNHSTPTAFAAADAANDLRGTPTLIVDPSFLSQFAVDDVPFLIVTDAQGILRVLQPVSDDALDPGGTIDSAIARIGTQWPSARGAPPHPAPQHPSTPPAPLLRP